MSLLSAKLAPGFVGHEFLSGRMIEVPKTGRR